MTTFETKAARAGPPTSPRWPSRPIVWNWYQATARRKPKNPKVHQIPLKRHRTLTLRLNDEITWNNSCILERPKWVGGPGGQFDSCREAMLRETGRMSCHQTSSPAWKSCDLGRSKLHGTFSEASAAGVAKRFDVIWSDMIWLLLCFMFGDVSAKFSVYESSRVRTGYLLCTKFCKCEIMTHKNAQSPFWTIDHRDL